MFFTAELILFPSRMVTSAKSGIDMCMNVIIPSLFPFFVVSNLMVKLGITEKLGRLFEPLMKPLFNLGGSCSAALILGLVGGYPVGAKTAVSLYNDGRCTKSEAERMLSFCNNSGPAFIFGVVGAGVFEDMKIALWLYISHIAASIITGILFRGYGGASATASRQHKSSETMPFPAAFVDSVTSSFNSIIGVCGFVIFFSVIISMVIETGTLTKILAALGSETAVVETVIKGMIELTSGVWSLKNMLAGSITLPASLASFMLGWAGLSVHCQTMSVIAGSDLSVKPYIAGKALQSIISIIITYALLKITHPAVAVINVYGADKTVTLSPIPAFTIAVSLAAAVTLLYGAAYKVKNIQSCQKRGSKH